MTQEQPTLYATVKAGGVVEIDFNKMDAEGVHIYGMRDGETVFSFLASETHAAYVDNRPLLAAGKPETRQYKAVFFIGKSEIGLTSAVVLPLPVGGRGGDSDEEDDASQYAAGPSGEGSKSHSLFAGQGAVIDLAGHESILTKAKVAMVVPFGASGARVAGGARGAEIVALKEALSDVRAYMKNKTAYERAGYRDLALSRGDLEALIPVVEGKMPIVAVVHRASDIRQVLAFARDERVKVILEGAEEGWMVAGEIAKAGVPVLLNPLNDRPESYEELASTMDNAGRLAAAGVTVALESTGGSARVRETRYGAGNAVSHGMSYAAALAAVTINPAKIFGVADRTGSLEPGKDADLVIWTGDPFEPLSQPTAVFIHGQSQPMTSRQIELRDRYKDLGRRLPPGYTHP